MAQNLHRMRQVVLKVFPITAFNLWALYEWMEGHNMWFDILGIIIISILVLPLLSKGKKFETIERRHELQQSMKKLQEKYTH